jgi:hypothetical protein
MGIPFEIPPLLDVILTLSAMLGLFAYVYWLAGKEGRQMHSVDGIKAGTVTQRSLLMSEAPA